MKLSLNEQSTNIKLLGEHLEHNHKDKSLKQGDISILLERFKVSEKAWKNVFSGWEYTKAAETRREKKQERK